MRISVPNIPHAILSAKSARKAISIPEAVDRVAEFIRPGNIVVLTGAGVSVDSGIRAYRGNDGRYMNPNYQPIFYQELVDESSKGAAFRQRYWLRSYLGYPPVRDSQPNTTHFALAALQVSGLVPKIITQNVDGLHHKALHTAPQIGPVQLEKFILELHGTLHRVKCKHGHHFDRSAFQDLLSATNPRWREIADGFEASGTKPRTNPDGDVAIDSPYDDFAVPDCPTCLSEGRKNNVLKPEVIFFGESIPAEVKQRSFSDIDSSGRLLIIGSTLATYSAYRLLRHAIETNKPTLMINVGPTRADGIVPAVEKIDIRSGDIIREVVGAVVGNANETIQRMLRSGIVNPPPADDDDRAPRAAG